MNNLLRMADRTSDYLKRATNGHTRFASAVNITRQSSSAIGMQEEASEPTASELFAVFAGGMAIVLCGAWRATMLTSPGIKKLDKVIILWFVLCGCLHIFFEGYLVLNHESITSKTDLFGQLWNEYSKSDARYLNRDSFVLTIETLTVLILGPSSLLTAVLIAAHHPLRFPLQAMVSVGHIYGDALYFGTSMYDLYWKGISHCEPEPYYFWFYYFFMNFIWIVIPGLLLYQSVAVTARAFSALDRMAKSVQASRQPPNGRLPAVKE